tara:strand:- start:301 stop:402 length:102 start_codon:yes stop_codon:yes gene_type:complete
VRDEVGELRGAVLFDPDLMTGEEHNRGEDEEGM